MFKEFCQTSWVEPWHFKSESTSKPLTRQRCVSLVRCYVAHCKPQLLCRVSNFSTGDYAVCTETNPPMICLPQMWINHWYVYVFEYANRWHCWEYLMANILPETLTASESASWWVLRKMALEVISIMKSNWNWECMEKLNGNNKWNKHAFILILIDHACLSKTSVLFESHMTFVTHKQAVWRLIMLATINWQS